ncbi:MATH domain and coiled-coil domain-containing protein At3g58270-like [Gossypium arboreum]|uniref:MATH domain and coiled-coil domain-containing protein At3g58270-like n=1 Tax=Gossypium arboreum TaxID=29729 RepID=UPI00081957BB|nr:MATH domain and coiled-coil domain-containing protein At3g58270-like [Gossypium arboreum]
MDINGLITKVTWRVETLSALHTQSNSMGVNGLITKVTWRIENFSSITDDGLYSENFTVDGYKWRLIIFPKGNKVDFWYFFFLEVADSATLPSGWSRNAQFGFAVINQFDRELSITKALGELHDPKRGYLLNDACLFEAYVSTDRTKGLISHELMIKTDSDRHETDEADSSTHPSEEIVRRKRWLATLEEALDRNPFHFYGSREFSSLKQAFKILASFDCSSTTFTIEQKKELLAMEESLKELADRAAKAMQDMNCLTEKKSIKLTITHKLDRNVIRYKEVESEVKQEMKMELEALEMQWAEYEAMAKVAMEEESIVLAEWGRIKEFITSIKGKI